MRTGLTIIRNTALLSLSSLGARFLLLASHILLARYLGVKEFGVYVVVFSYVLLFETLVEFALKQLIMRDVARDPALAASYFTNAIALKSCLYVLALTIMVITSLLLGYSAQIRWLIYILSLGLLLSGVTDCCIAMFNAFQHMHYSATLQVLEQVLFIAVALIIVLMHGSVFGIVIGQVLAQGMTQLVGVFLVRRKLGLGFVRVQYHMCKSLAKQSLPFFGVASFTTSPRYLDPILLSSMQSVAAAGLYDVASRLMKITTQFSRAFSDALYPVVSSQAAEPDLTSLKMTYRRSLHYMLIAVVPLLVVTTTLGADLIRLLYGSAFLGAAAAFQIFAWKAGLQFFSQVFGRILYALEHQKAVLKVTGVSAFLSVLLSIVLIPSYSYVGAAIGTLVAAVVEFALLFTLIHRQLPRIPLTMILLKPIGAGILMGLCCVYIKVMPLFFVVALSCVVYVVVLILSGGISRGELQALQNFLQAKRHRKSLRR